jgi:hypothetical protein
MDYNNDYNDVFQNSAYDYMLSISDSNVNRRLDNETATQLISKLPVHYGECTICYDDVNARQIVYLPCCNAEMCKSCIINTLTQNTKDCPMCRGNLDENIRNFKVITNSNTKNTNTNMKPTTYVQYTPQHKLENNKTDDWLNRLNIERTFTTKKTADGLKIKLVKHKFTNLQNEEEKKPISFVFHNNIPVNRYKFYSFIKEFKEKLDASSFENSTEVFKGIHKLCKVFTDKYKTHKGNIPDLIFNKIYTQLQNILIIGENK